MKTLEEIEKEAILQRLWYFNGHRKMTAESLGIALRTLGLKIKAYRNQGHVIPRHTTTYAAITPLAAAMTREHACQPTSEPTSKSPTPPTSSSST